MDDLAMSSHSLCRWGRHQPPRLMRDPALGGMIGETSAPWCGLFLDPDHLDVAIGDLIGEYAGDVVRIYEAAIPQWAGCVDLPEGKPGRLNNLLACLLYEAPIAPEAKT